MKYAFEVASNAPNCLLANGVTARQGRGRLAFSIVREKIDDRELGQPRRTPVGKSPPSDGEEYREAAQDPPITSQSSTVEIKVRVRKTIAEPVSTLAPRVPRK